MKVLIASLTLMLSTVAFSQTHTSGHISIGNGQTTIGISVGNQNPNQHQLVSRVLMLEQAVRDLQIQVYNLSISDMPSASLFECSITAFGKKYYEEGETLVLAKNKTRKSCERDQNEMFCKDKDIKCEQLR